MSNKLKLVRTRDVKLPYRGTSKSAGIDFYVPEDFKTKRLSPYDDVNIPLGVKVQVPAGHALIMFNKSGVVVNKHLLVGACVIDEDYQGEIHAHLIHTGTDYVTIRPGDKIVQGLIIPINYATIEEVTSEAELWEGKETERGTGGFGSTGDR